MECASIERAMKAYIEVRLRGPIDVGDLSRRIGYSKAHARDLFARATGIPLRRYITQRRMANAAFDILYTPQSLLDIALEYGYEHYDTFARAFRRVTGCTPVEFRRVRPRIMRRNLGEGIFGVDMIHARHERSFDMDRRIEQSAHSVLLYGVPKAHYGAYGGCTPYPISLKACANYLGEDIDYADAIVGCGAAFRLTWNTKEWDGGNVDVCHTYDQADPHKVYIQGVTALGRAYRLLMRDEHNGKAQHQAFIVECLRQGVPVIAMGMVGPPEAGLVTGFRDDGATMLGWSVFQDGPEYRQTIEIDDSGYYATDKWWENGVDALIAMGDRVCEPIAPEAVAQRALEVMRPRMDGAFAKGLLAYDAWAADMARDDQFPDLSQPGGVLSPANELRPENAPEVALPTLAWRLMCQGDGADCLSDGRSNAARYFARHAKDVPPFAEAAKAFQIAAERAADMYRALGGWQRGEAQARALGMRENRDRLIALIRGAQVADEAAMKALSKA